ncbi:MAG: chromate transporter [Bacteroidales bacterium]|nr:chromate transporter [Bacteroidales bacterium]MBR1950046.1 chromate transporter [Bacteroidales bacterium]MBR2438178.1 chromate transporter [Bacteroidales bacterium]MBR4087778.1 chromate transporter [Bacteroidales bacterium]
MIYLQLFFTFFVIGLFTFGGGYAMLSLIQNEVVVNHAWITAQEFTDMVAISQMTPGPIGINSATYVGYAVSGNIFGSLTATFAVCLPSFLIILTICKIYNRFKKSNVFASLMKTLRPVVIGMIGAAAGILITKENFIDWTSWVLFAAAFIASQWLKINPILLIIAGGVIGYFIY